MQSFGENLQYFITVLHHERYIQYLKNGVSSQRDEEAETASARSMLVLWEPRAICTLAAQHQEGICLIHSRLSNALSEGDRWPFPLVFTSLIAGNISVNPT